MDTSRAEGPPEDLAPEVGHRRLSERARPGSRATGRAAPSGCPGRPPRTGVL